MEGILLHLWQLYQGGIVGLGCSLTLAKTLCHFLETLVPPCFLLLLLLFLLFKKTAVSNRMQSCLKSVLFPLF